MPLISIEEYEKAPQELGNNLGLTFAWLRIDDLRPLVLRCHHGLQLRPDGRIRTLQTDVEMTW